MSIPGAIGVRDIYFNGVDITALSPYLNFSYRDIHNLPDRDVVDYKRSRKDGYAFVNAEYGGATKDLIGWFSAPTREIMEQLRDLLLSKLQGKNGTLQLNESGAPRKYYGSLKNYVPTAKKGGGFEVFTLTFRLSDPFGYDLNPIITGLGTPITFSFTDKPYTFRGTYDSVPAITLVLNSFVGSGDRGITVTNPATGIYQTVTRTWTAADIVIFDPANNQVLVNGVATAWTGGLLSWAVGPGFIRISDTLTQRNIAAQVSELPRYV